MPALQRLLGQLLGLRVDRQPDVVARDGRLLSDPAEVLPRRVHPVLDQPLRSGQVALVIALDPRHADQVAGLVVGEPGILELLLGHLAEVPEDVRAHGPRRVLAHGHLQDVDAGEIGRVLLDVVRDAPGHVDRDRDRAEDVVAGVVQPRPELIGRDIEELGQVEQDALGVVAERLTIDRDDDARSVVDQRVAVRVVDHAARRGHLDQADRVVLRVLLVLLGGEHLEEPEPRRERREHHQHQRGQDLHAKAHPGFGHGRLTALSPAGHAP